MGARRDPLKLTDKQLDVLRLLCQHAPGAWLSTRQIGEPLGVKDTLIRLGFGSKVLRPLQKRGFLLGARMGPRQWAHWSLGPMADALKETGILE